MTRPYLDQQEAPGQYHRHPTPAEIHQSILRALHDDHCRAMREDYMLIPVRVYKLIGDAITRACDEHEAGGVQ